MIHAYEFQCPAFQALSGDEVKIYLAMRSRYNATNNGSIRLSSKEAGKIINKSKATGARCVRRLEHFGFVEVSAGARYYFDQKRKCREYELTAIAKTPAKFKTKLPYGSRDFMELSEEKVQQMFEEEVKAKTKTSKAGNTHGSKCETDRSNVIKMERK